MTRHTIDSESVLHAAAGSMEKELEIVGRRWALRLKPRGLASCRFPQVSLSEHGERDCLSIDDLPSVLRCLPSRVSENAGQWLPVLQALSDAIDVVNPDPQDEAAVAERLESVCLDALSWLGSYGGENEIPTTACFATGPVAADAYSMELRDGRFLGLRVSGGKGNAATRQTCDAVQDEPVVDALRDLRTRRKRARRAGPAEQQARPEAAGHLDHLETLVRDLEKVLTVVVGHLEVSERRGQPPAGTALETARRGIDIAQGFLKRGRSAPTAVSATPPSAPAAISVPATVAEAFSMLDGALEDGVELVSALDSDLPPVAVDPRSLHRALLHLVLNARDALRGSGRIVVSARMLSGPGGRYVEIAVTENAAGIPRDRGERALERSYISGDLSRSPAAGLVQVRDFVERCGGCVRIDCRAEGGTRVRMQLPTLSDARARPDFVEHRLERATA